MSAESHPCPTPSDANQLVADTFPDAWNKGYRCESLQPGEAVARWSYDPTVLRPGGIVSGPVQFMAADIALWFLSFTVLGLEPMAVTSNLTIDFLRPAAGGDLLARATLLRAGRTRITGRVDIWVDGVDDRVVAHATGSYSMLAPPPSN